MGTETLLPPSSWPRAASVASDTPGDTEADVREETERNQI